MASKGVKIAIGVGLLGAFGIGAYFVLRKPKLQMLKTDIQKQGNVGDHKEKVYDLVVGRRDTKIFSSKNTTGSNEMKFPLFNYSFTTSSNDLDWQGFPKVKMVITNNLTKETTTSFLSAEILN
jgi:hypothetical protein